MREKGFASILIILGIILFASIAGGAYYLGISKNKSQTQSPLTTPTPQLTLIQEGTSNPDETSNWKKYINKNLQYQISYPGADQYQENFPGSNQLTEYENDPAQPSLLGSTNIDLVLNKNNTISSIWINAWSNLGIKVTDLTSRDEWCKKLQPELQGQQECFYKSDIKVEDFEFNSYKAFKVSGGRDNSFEIRYYVPHVEYIYEISTSRPMQELDNSLPGKVLSTFKFLN